jgi:hypothetical protein
MTTNSLAEVQAIFWKPGDTVPLDEIDGNALWGSKWGVGWDVHTLAAKDLSTEEQPVERFTDEVTMLTFTVVGSASGYDGCPLATLYDYDGIDVFHEWYDILVKIAKEKFNPPEKKKKKVKGHRRRKSTIPDMVRFVTVWSYWEERSYEGESDYGVDLEGVLDMNHLHIEGDPEHERRQQEFAKKEKRSRRRLRRGVSHTRRAQGRDKHSF